MHSFLTGSHVKKRSKVRMCQFTVIATLIIVFVLVSSGVEASEVGDMVSRTRSNDAGFDSRQGQEIFIFPSPKV